MAHPLDTEGFFIQEIYQLYKATQRVMLPAKDYKEIIKSILAAEHSTTKTRKEYYLLHKYEVLKVDGVKRLIKRRKRPSDPILFFVSIEETFEVIKQVHIATGHGGRDKMIKQLKKKFANVTTEAITLFKTLCFKCQMNSNANLYCSSDDENTLQIDKSKFPNVATRRKRRKSSAVSGDKNPGKARKLSIETIPENGKKLSYANRSFTHRENGKELTNVTSEPDKKKRFGTRAEVDLIDMRSMAAGDFEWIMVYRDDATKFYFLRPLASRQASEVALELLDIFTTFGAPEVLQSDHGVEFVADVIDELRQVWQDLVIVHGITRHQSTKEKHADIKLALANWLDDNYDSDWTIGLKFVQLQRNTTNDYRIQQTPFAAVFGREPKTKLSS